MFIRYLPESKISVIRTVVLYDIKVFFAWFSVFCFFFLEPVWLVGSLLCFIFVSCKFYISVFKALRRSGGPAGPAAAMGPEPVDGAEETLSD